MRRVYPRLQIVRNARGSETYALTYVEKSGDSWSYATLLRLPLVFGQGG